MKKFLKQDSGLLKSARSCGVLSLIFVISLFGCGLLSAKNVGTSKVHSTDSSVWPLLYSAQIKAGVGVLMDTGHPTPMPTPTTVKGSKSNSDDLLSSMRPVENVTDNMGVTLFTTIKTTKSNTFRTILGIGEDEAPVGVIEVSRRMNMESPTEYLIPAGHYEVSMWEPVDSMYLAMTNLETGALSKGVISINKEALLQALGDDFMDAQGIPCLLGDEYTSAILLNLLAAMLVENKSALDLSLQMTLDTKLIVGQPVTFTATVVNSGGAPTTGTITVTDALPSTLSLVSIKANGFSCLTFGQQTSCQTSTIVASGASLQLQIMAQVKGGEGSPTSGTEIKNCAKVSTDGDTNPENDQGCVTGKVE